MLDVLVGRNRESAVRAGVVVEWFTVAWMAAEASLAIGAGVVAHSVLLTAFGFDSLIELLSGGVLVWRLSREASGAAIAAVERVEVRATKLSAVLLVLLCLYVLLTSLGGLLFRVEPESSLVGIAVSASALVIMPLLAWAKRAINKRLRSPALTADIAETMTCAYMAGATLLGVMLNATVHLWWAEYVAALVLLVWLVRETREAVEAAGEGQSAEADG